MKTGNTTWVNTYNSDGLRTSRSDGTTTYTYYYEDGRLSAIKRNDLDMWIIYDENGPVTLKYGVGTFHYVTNPQGDVVAIVGKDGQHLVEYTYDAWGKVTSITGDYAYNLGIHNPILYRGYIYDHETGLYYCQSRYYDPQTHRFLNADAFAATGQGLLGNNMFAYCGNNPISNIDVTGNSFSSAFSAISCRSEGYTKYNCVIYYYNSLSQQNLDQAAMRNHPASTAMFKAAGSFDELTYAFNNMPCYINDVFIYMHSDENELSFYYAQYFGADDIANNFNEINVSGEIYLFSCKGGRGNLASTLATTSNCTVVASVYKVSFGDGYARCGWENYASDCWTNGSYSWYRYYPNGERERVGLFFILTK